MDVGTNDLSSPNCHGTVLAENLHSVACEFTEIPSFRHMTLCEVIRLPCKIRSGKENV